MTADGTRPSGFTRGLMLGAILGMLATLLVGAGLLLRDRQRVASRPPPMPATTVATAQRRTAVHGELVAVDAQTLTLRQPDGLHTIPIQSDTEFCRVSCRDVVSDLRLGDDIETGIQQIGTVTLTPWVFANATGGWVAIDAVDGDHLTVRWGNSAANPQAFTVVIGPNTRWNTASRGPQLLCPGQQVHLVGGEQMPGVVSAWTLSPGQPSAAC